MLKQFNGMDTEGSCESIRCQGVKDVEAASFIEVQTSRSLLEVIEGGCNDDVC